MVLCVGEFVVGSVGHLVEVVIHCEGPTQNRAGASLCLLYARKTVLLSCIAVQRFVCGWPLRARTVILKHTYIMINILEV